MRNPEEILKEMTLEEIGEKFNLTRERVRQIKLDIIKRQEEAKKKQRGTTLVDILGDELMCTNCFI